MKYRIDMRRNKIGFDSRGFRGIHKSTDGNKGDSDSLIESLMPMKGVEGVYEVSSRHEKE